MRNSDHSVVFKGSEPPWSMRFGDHFYSAENGREECRYVFIDGNRVLQRWQQGKEFSIVELGFGTGLNFLESWRLWRETRPADSKLSFTSFEAYPLTLSDMALALQNWPELATLADRLLARWQDLTVQPALWPMDDQTDLCVVRADVSNGLASWQGNADAWFLDGFAPARNPEMWSEEIAATVYERTMPGGRFATYTSAGWVRRNFEAAGFCVQRMPGFGRKRHMLVGHKPLEK